MCDGVPGVAALAVSVVSSRCFAMPKSRTSGSPSSRTRMFWGFRSRWIVPFPWACATPSATFAISRRWRRCAPVRERRDLVEPFVQLAAAHVLHHEIGVPVVLARVEDLDDVRVAQHSEVPDLAPEALDEVGAAGAGIVDDLERDQAVADRRVLAEVDRPHAPPAELPDDPVGPDPLLRPTEDPPCRRSRPDSSMKVRRYQRRSATAAGVPRAA